MTAPPFPGPGALPTQPHPRTWFERWLVTILIVAAVFIIVAFIGAVFYGIEYAFRASYPYQQAVQRATDSPAVAEKIGVPLGIGWLVLGHINSSGREGSTTMSIPISGPCAVGHIIVVPTSTRINGSSRLLKWKWTVKTSAFRCSSRRP